MHRSTGSAALALSGLLLVLAPPHPLQAATPSQIARVLGGLAVDDAAVTSAVSEHTLTRYTSRVDDWWQRFDERIGVPMTTWALTTLQQTEGTVFYPFAGADFPTVHRLYPNATRYVLVALEPAGRMPALDGSSEDAEATLTVFREMMEQFHRRGYFITGELLDQFGRHSSPVEGITPVLAMTAEREGFEVRQITPIRVADGGELVPHEGDRAERDTWSSVRLELTRRADDAPVLLDYLRLDLGNENLEANPAEAAFVVAMSVYPTVVKAASHLLQYRSFSVVREAILGHAPTLVQDDSGLDYDDLSRHYEVRLFGAFSAPHSDFPETLQASLVRAYAEQATEPLPFRFGYWKEGVWCLQYAHTRR